eukprot:c12221_g1_i3.p3 GENE.c12221_g1_i3~~c12221_g1_i3.p3  ORF type:complete len:119 (-),score=31.36 c12221_g1_i3:786-1142(-)
MWLGSTYHSLPKSIYVFVELLAKFFFVLVGLELPVAPQMCLLMWKKQQELLLLLDEEEVVVLTTMFLVVLTKRVVVGFVCVAVCLRVGVAVTKKRNMEILICFDFVFLRGCVGERPKN